MSERHRKLKIHVWYHEGRNELVYGPAFMIEFFLGNPYPALVGEEIFFYLSPDDMRVDNRFEYIGEL